MPTVPIIQDSAQLDTSTGRQRVQATPDAFGAQEARAAGAVAQGIDKVAQVAAEIDDDFNEARAAELDNQLSSRIRNRLYNTTDGYLSTQRGRNALDTRGQTEADIDGYAAELANTESNPRARAMFQQVARNRITSELGTIAQHAARENVNYQNQQSEARLNEFTDNAVAAYADPVAVEAQMTGAIGSIGADGRRQGGEIETLARRNGWTPEITDQRRRQYQSDVMTSVIVHLATTDPQAADEMIARIRPTLTAQAAGELLTTVRAAQAQARERTTGAVWQALANGQDPRSLPEWEDFTTNPIYGREHETFNEYRRQRAASAVSNTYTTRLSEAAGDRLEALGALDPRRFMLATDYATGRLNVAARAERRFVGGTQGWQIVQPDMTPQEFQRETGMTPQQAQSFFSQLNDDDLLRVLNRRSGQTDNTAIDQAYDDIIRVARPMAQSLGLSVSGQGEDNAEQRGQFEAYVYRQARAHVLATGQRPDDAAIQAITRRALLQAPSGGWGRQGRYAFQGTAYNDIPVEARRAIEADWQAQTGAQPTHTQVERRYAEAMQSMGRQ